MGYSNTFVICIVKILFIIILSKKFFVEKEKSNESLFYFSLFYGEFCFERIIIQILLMGCSNTFSWVVQILFIRILSKKFFVEKEKSNESLFHFSLFYGEFCFEYHGKYLNICICKSI